MFRCICFALCSCLLSWLVNAQAVSVDELGVRKFSKVPSIGIHPRVMLSPEDLDPWRKTVAQTHKGKEFFAKRYRSKTIDLLVSLDDNLSDAELDKRFPNLGPIHDLLYATLDVVYHQDKARSSKICKAVENFARVVLARSAVNPKWGKIAENIGNVKGLRGIPTGLDTLWMRGGSAFALSYDLLYNDMSEDQRKLCRKALSVATQDLISWGMGFPRTRACSNHYPYHGELGIMLLAIEGEEGYHADRYAMFTEMLHNWFEGSLYPTGGSNEDGYVANTALRETTFAMIAMARRGDNLFHHPGYQAYWKWMVLSLPPGESGGRSVEYTCNAVAPYESMPTLSLWASPENPLLNFYFRQYKGADYSKNRNWQYGDMSTLFAADYQDTPSLPLAIEKLNLPLNAYFPPQGLIIARSDWSDQALYLNFLCRPDAWIDKHECVDRGRFVLSALGRDWIVARNFRSFDRADAQTLMHIDGQSQLPDRKGRGITPPGKIVAQTETDVLAGGAMDLKYAYDWQWSNEMNAPGPDWEPETTTLKDLGWAWESSVQPPALHRADDPNDRKYGYNGLNIWRRSATPVKYAYRTCLLVRGAHPYAIVLDDFRKDDQPRSYESYLQLADDVRLSGAEGETWVLSEASGNGNRRLLIWPAGTSDTQMIAEELVVKESKTNKELRAPRAVVKRSGLASDLKLFLLPASGAITPQLQYDAAGKKAIISWDNQRDEVYFSDNRDGRTTIRLSRNGRELAISK